MNGELEQLVVLTSYGNVHLCDKKSNNSLALFRSNSAFHYAHRVEFVDEDETILASDPIQWFRYLRDARRLWLMNFGTHNEIPMHQAEAFVGGVNRGILADYENSTELWVPRWGAGCVRYMSIRARKCTTSSRQKCTRKSGALCLEKITLWVWKKSRRVGGKMVQEGGVRRV